MHLFFVLDRETFKPLRVERLPYDYSNYLYVRVDRYRDYLIEKYSAIRRTQLLYVVEILKGSVALYADDLIDHIEAVGIGALADQDVWHRANADNFEAHKLIG